MCNTLNKNNRKIVCKKLRRLKNNNIGIVYIINMCVVYINCCYFGN